MKIAHLSTVHPRTDTRIRLKEAASLADALDAEVSFFVQDGQGGEEDNLADIRIVDTGPRPQGGRILRMTRGAWRMYRAVRAARVDIVHLHDPELIPIGILLRLGGVRVIYDVHEDLPRQISSKPYIPVLFRRPVAWIAGCFEWIAGQSFSGIIPATPVIGAHFPPQRSVLVQNFPLPGELASVAGKNYKDRPPDFAFIGGISSIRGTIQMIDAVYLAASPDTNLQMAGKFVPASHRAEAEARKGWPSVAFHGWADRPTVARILSEVRGGLVLYLPLPNHINAQPNKLFEYMSAGVPVIASDFPLWRQIVDGADCGILVDPEDPQAIAHAIDRILDDPQEAEAMGQRGKRAVETTYNWPTEAQKLVAFYHERLGVPLKTRKQKDIS